MVYLVGIACYDIKKSYILGWHIAMAIAVLIGSIALVGVDH